MAAAHVYIVTLLSKTHLNRGRYVLSIDAVNRDNMKSLIEKREKEKQNYIEDDDMSGGCSPEIELHLENGRCKIQMLILGALRPSAPLDKGEDILEFNETQGECRKQLSLIPSCDGSMEDTGTIKFKVGDEIKHTVHIHDIPTQKSQNLNRSTTSTESTGSPSSNSLYQTTRQRFGSADDLDEDYGLQGSVRETRTSTSGGDFSEVKLNADPDPPGLDDAVGGMRISNSGPTVMPPEETPYDTLLLDNSLYALARALPPNDANILLTGLLVSTSIQQQSRFDNSTSIVAANFTSLKHWKTKKTTRKDMAEVTSQQLFEDLIKELENIGRRDIVQIMKRKLAVNKKLDHGDFSLL